MSEFSSHQSISTLKAVIQVAFKNIRLGEGVGLWEGQAIDDYASVEERLIARQRDEKIDWHHLTEKDLNRCSSSLSFFDPLGMRFHLPAFMMLEIDGEDTTGSLVFHLTNLDKYTMSMFTALDQTQREAVFDFLRWCSHHPDYEYDRAKIKEAMENYWSLKI